MIIFIAGVHAVGKSFLCKHYELTHEIMHKSASEIIKEYKKETWGVNKKATDLDDNQRVLIEAVNSINDSGGSLLLDGHFVLINSLNEFVRLSPEIFFEMGVNGIILIENSEDVIRKRFNARGASIEFDMEKFIFEERNAAEKVSEMYKIKLIKLFSPEAIDFERAMQEF